MKQLKEIKDKEKIKTFNSLYRFCREEVTAMKNSFEYDRKIDNEYLLNKVLGLTTKDWNKINKMS